MGLITSGQITVTDVTDGYSVVLSPNNYTFQGTTDSVSGTQSVTATASAVKGTTAVSATINAASIVAPTGFTITNSGNTIGPSIIITASNTVADNGSFTVPVVVNDNGNNINFNLKFSYSVAYTGAGGRGISSITDEYCLSTSSSAAVGSWNSSLPPYQENRYYWVRQHIVYDDGTEEYTTAVYDGALTSANGNAYTANQAATAAVESATRAETAANDAVASAGRAETAATTAEASAAQAISDAADAAQAASAAQSSANQAIADAATAQSAAESAQADATAAGQAASAAQASADSAQDSADLAMDSANDAIQAANVADGKAVQAYQAAEAAQSSADDAQDAADAAQASADVADQKAVAAGQAAAAAQSSADAAQLSAATANRAANGALSQLATVEDVVDVLNWIQDHGTYIASQDTEVVPGKYYFTRTGTSPNYSYTFVTNPTGNPSTSGYYECTGVDEAITNYVTTHLALTNDGLYIVMDNQGYKLKLAANGAYIIDPQGQTVATYGESITFDSSRPQRIGNNNVYIEYYDSNNDSVADALRIVGANITLQSGSTVESAISAVESSLTTEIGNLQDQIDGAINTWFYAVDPTTSNTPAEDWTTTDEKNIHLGDLYYNTSNGHAFRWMLSNGVYDWGEITDVDAIKAIEDAAKAQATANSKRRIFGTQPTPPYDVNDLWVEGSTGDIKKCITAKIESQSYSASDWVLASKYTDDTKADSVETALNTYKTTVSETYATQAALTQTESSIKQEVSSTYTTVTAFNTYTTSNDAAVTAATNTANSAASSASSAASSAASAAQSASDSASAAQDAADAAQDLKDRADAGEFDGASITVTKTEYKEGTSNTMAPTGTWSSTPVSVAEGNYLWTKVTYSDNTYSYSVAKQGVSGVSPTVTGTTVEYKQSTNGTTPPTGTWDSAPPTAIQGQYMWVRSTVTYSDSNTSVSYSVSRNGSDGTSVSVSKTEYQSGTSNTTAPTGSWSATPVAVAEGSYLWTKVTYTDGNVAYSVAKQGVSGVSISSVTNHYLATSASSGVTKSTSGWTDSIQSMTSTKQFLWNYETVTGSNGSTISETNPVIIGRYGQDGSSGKGIASITEHYQVSSSNTLPPTTWSDTVVNTTDTNRYLWNYETITYTDNTTEDSTKRIIGTQGESVTVTTTEYQAGTSASTAPTGTWSATPVAVAEGSYLWTKVTFSDGTVSYSVAKQGVSGVSISSVTNYYLATSASSGVTRSTSGWTTTIQSINSTKQYLWNYEVTTGSNGSTLNTTDPIIIGRFGQDGAAGKGISSITEHYQVSSSNSTPPTTWSDTMVNTTTTNKYLWNYETITYTDNTTSDTTKRIIGTHGATGTSVSVSKTEYQSGTSSTTAPTGTWSTTPVSVAEGNYLWTKVTYSDNSYSYSVAKQGVSGTNGTSPTVTSTVLDYQKSTSGTTIPTGNWSSSPLAPTTTEYVWTRSTTTYSDGATAISYSVGGKVGEKGDTGKGVSSVVAQYYVSTSKTTQTGGSWGETSPTWSSGKYLWLRNKITYTNPASTEYTTPWCDNSWEAANAVQADLDTVKTTYVTNTTFETRAESIEASVEEVETTTKTYADGLIETEVTNRNAAITTTANGINATVATKVGNNEVISKINQSSESVTIDASKININGVITAGSLATSSDIPTKVSDLTNDSGFQTSSDVATALSPYATSASVSSTYAQRIEAVIQTQRIYKSAPSGTNTMTGTTTWVTSVADSQNAWTTKRPTYDSNYPVLFTAIQKQTVSQYANNGTTCTCTTPVKDDTLTIIDGGHITTGTIDAARIAAHTITANHLATDAIKSSNYQASPSATSPYSAVGTFLDLSTGNLYMPNFGVNGDSAYLNGEITANSGRIGLSDSGSYWKIGSTMDYNQQVSASMEAVGTAYIQVGNFQFSDGLLNTQKYTANNQITYLKQGSTYWDFGVQAPELDTTKTGYVAGIDDNFLYIRNHDNTIPSLKTDWNYVFRVDKNGMIWINGKSLDQKYAAIDSGSIYVVKNGDSTITGSLTVTGSINGTATKATQLSNARTFIANLASTTAGSFDGLANVSLGVTGTLGVGNGGTGKASWTQYGIVYANTTSALSQLAVGTSGQVLMSGGNAAPGWTNQSSLAAGTATKWASAQKVYVTLGTASTTTTIQGGSSTAQTIGIDGTLGVGNGGTGATTFTSGAALIGNGTGAIQTRAIRNNTTQGALGWTSSSTDTTLITTNTLAYWNGAYQNTTSNLEYVKLGKLGTVVTHNIDEFITTAGGIIDGSLSVTDLTAGNLIVTGAGRFTNGLYGDLTGTATSVSNSLKIQLNGGTTEGTNQFTFNGSAAKNVNITKSSVGLGNVENTALSTWAGSSNLTTIKLGTLAAAAVKSVDTSIGAGSTSANLPTSAAVASFVEGKGYVTSSGVTSVRVQATSPVVSSSNTAQTSTLNTTISLADAYGDTKNPYGTKNANVVLAGPASGSAAAPGFRALVAADIPTLAASKVGLGNLTNDKQVKGLASGTTAGHFVTWGSDGYTVADSGYTAGQVVKTLASNNDGKIVLTYLDGTTSDPIEVKIIGSSGSSVSYADALNVNGTAVGSATQPVFINAQGKPQTANSIPKLNNGTTGGTFYAPTAAGTSGQFLVSSGSGAPTWTTITRVTGVKGNAESSYRTGNINLTPANIGALALSGGTLTDALTLAANKYYDPNSVYALNLNNSDIIGLNSIFFGDTSDDGREGINFYRDATHWDSLHAVNGILYFTPNRAKGSAGERQEVYTTPNYQRGTTDISIRPLVHSTRANRLAFLPADQVIIEKTTDGGATWVDAGYSDAIKIGLFNNLQSTIQIPLLNSAKSTQCGLRVTLTGMKYDVPEGTAETAKYNYWNADHIIRQERYFNVREWWFWLSSNNDTIRVQIEAATGAASTTWRNMFDADFGMTGWSGSDWIRAGGGNTFGGGTTQTGNYWNWRLTFWSKYADGKTEFNSATIQNIYTIYCYGDNVWGKPNNLMANDHLYSWDNIQNATFPANVTATKFIGTLQGNADTATKATQDASGNTITSTYAKLSGATFTGAVNFANNTWNLVGDDAYIGDMNQSGKIGIKGNNGATGIVFVPYSGSTNNTISVDGAGNLTISGTTIGTFSGNLSGNATTATSATKATQDGSGNTITSTYVNVDGSNKMTGNLIIRKAGTGANDWASRTSNPSLIFEATDGQTAGLVYTQYDSVKAPDSITVVGAQAGTYFIAPNIQATGSFYGSLSGNATSATKATNDSDNNAINTTYAKKSGATFTGAVTGTSFGASGYLASNTANSSTAGGIALYSTTPTSYGIAMRGTGNGGKHGYVQGDWAIYNYMTGADNRGFVWRNSSTSKNVASISSVGNAAFSGSMTVGANEANTSGCRLEFDSTNSCLNFVFA